MAENALTLDYMPKHLWHKCHDCETYEMAQTGSVPNCWACDKPMQRSQDPQVEFSIHNQRARGFNHDR